MNRYNLLCIFYLAFGAFFYGYDSGLTTSVIGYPQVSAGVLPKRSQAYECTVHLLLQPGCYSVSDLWIETERPIARFYS